jgi:glycosyltransferase involved in cell wall biosynthesis
MILKLAKYKINRSIRKTLESIKYSRVKPQQDQKFWIVSCSRNPGTDAITCLNSVYRQNYPKDLITHLFIDDESTDGTDTLVNEWLSDHTDHSVKYIRNEKRAGGTANTLKGFQMATRGTIIIEINGDDWLPDDDVLHFFNKVYADDNVWMTYNTHRYANRDKEIIAHPVPREVIRTNSFREYKWITRHLHTFRHELFTHLKEEIFIDPQTGDYWASADDQAIYFSLLELCGFHSLHIYRETYIYNYHENSDDVLDFAGSRNRAERIRKLSKYKPLEHLNSNN